jgi:hypothetical protein
MAISLYDATVAGYLQTTTAVSGVLAKGLAHCLETGEDPETLVTARLFPDMLPLTFQVWSVKHHSLGAIEGCRAGAFGPPAPMPETMTYADLQAVLTDTCTALAAITPEEVESIAGNDVTFQAGSLKLPFTTEGFLLSFSLPNFHFHATTTYDILRSRGVKLGKRDYMGPLRMKG